MTVEITIRETVANRVYSQSFMIDMKLWEGRYDAEGRSHSYIIADAYDELLVQFRKSISKPE